VESVIEQVWDEARSETWSQFLDHACHAVYEQADNQIGQPVVSQSWFQIARGLYAELLEVDD